MPSCLPCHASYARVPLPAGKVGGGRPPFFGAAGGAVLPQILPPARGSRQPRPLTPLCLPQSHCNHVSTAQHSSTFDHDTEHSSMQQPESRRIGTGVWRVACTGSGRADRARATGQDGGEIAAAAAGGCQVGGCRRARLYTGKETCMLMLLSLSSSAAVQGCRKE